MIRLQFIFYAAIMLLGPIICLSIAFSPNADHWFMRLSYVVGIICMMGGGLKLAHHIALYRQERARS